MEIIQGFGIRKCKLPGFIPKVVASFLLLLLVCLFSL